MDSEKLALKLHGLSKSPLKKSRNSQSSSFRPISPGDRLADDKQLDRTKFPCWMGNSSARCVIWTLSWIGMTWVDWRGSACCPQCFSSACEKRTHDWLLERAYPIAFLAIGCVVLCVGSVEIPCSTMCARACHVCLIAFCSPLQQRILPGLNGEYAVNSLCELSVLRVVSSCFFYA